MLYVKHVSFTVSAEAAQFLRDAILDSADYVEDNLRRDIPTTATDEPSAATVVAELRKIGRAIEATILVPSTPSEYNEILNIH